MIMEEMGVCLGFYFCFDFAVSISVSLARLFFPLSLSLFPLSFTYLQRNGGL